MVLSVALCVDGEARPQFVLLGFRCSCVLLAAVLPLAPVPLQGAELLSGGWLPLGCTGAGSELCQSCSYCSQCFTRWYCHPPSD